MAQNMRLGKKRGFTLVELSIVMAIIGILAMIVVPNGVTYTKKAREATLIDELHEYNLRTDLDYAIDSLGIDYDTTMRELLDAHKKIIEYGYVDVKLADLIEDF